MFDIPPANESLFPQGVLFLSPHSFFFFLNTFETSDLSVCWQMVWSRGKEAKQLTRTVRKIGP